MCCETRFCSHWENLCNQFNTAMASTVSYCTRLSRQKVLCSESAPLVCVTNQQHMWLHEKALPWMCLGNGLWNDIWRRCSCRDLLANGACKVPPIRRADRWDEMGQVEAGRPKHILRGRQEPWHSELMSDYYDLNFPYACTDQCCCISTGSNDSVDVRKPLCSSVCAASLCSDDAVASSV